jgi:glycosyltransferase involved in cell wall biosynthesis
MKTERRLRPLLIAEGANPALTSASLVGWSCVKAIAAVSDAHIVTHWRNRDDFLAAGLVEGCDFTAIDTRRAQTLAWQATKLLSPRDAFSWSLYAIFSNLVYPSFERAVWRTFEARLRAGEFDLVHRILPLSPTTPSPLAARLKRIKVPFVLGPLNGGVPWPKGFDEVRRAEKDGAGRLRGLYRFLPGTRSTREAASAIIAGSRTTARELAPHLQEKCIHLPENAIDTTRFALTPKPPREDGPLRIAFVGRLVALKGVDMLIEAAAPLIREGKLELDLIGDGPERGRLEQLLEREGIADRVELSGWIDHAALQPRLRRADALAFPSIREFGGGAVLEAMALGVPPLVLDHGGPPELVPPGTGHVLPLQSRAQIIWDLQGLFRSYTNDPEALGRLGAAAQDHIRRYFTWEAKAGQILEIYRWVLGERDEKPDWGVPLGTVVEMEVREVTTRVPEPVLCGAG